MWIYDVTKFICSRALVSRRFWRCFQPPRCTPCPSVFPPQSSTRNLHAPLALPAQTATLSSRGLRTSRGSNATLPFPTTPHHLRFPNMAFSVSLSFVSLSMSATGGHSTSQPGRLSLSPSPTPLPPLHSPNQLSLSSTSSPQGTARRSPSSFSLY